MPAHADDTWLSTSPQELHKTINVACAMMARAIEGFTAQRRDDPDESRDDFVARNVAEALPSMPAALKDMSIPKIIEAFGKLTDYIDAHPDVAPPQLKKQFMADCVGGNLPW